MSDSGQKFIARNRAPRVQIEYDVETGGSEKKIELPFVMGVISDLSGKGMTTQGAFGERKFLDIDVDNFDERLKACKPKVEFHVPNTLTEEEGQIPISITFESMADFAPDTVAKKIDPIGKLLEVRKQLSNLLTYMDGKVDAEERLKQALDDPSLLKALMAMPSVEVNNKDDPNESGK